MEGAIEALGSHVLDVRIFPENHRQAILLFSMLFSKAGRGGNPLLHSFGSK